MQEPDEVTTTSYSDEGTIYGANSNSSSIGNISDTTSTAQGINVDSGHGVQQVQLPDANVTTAEQPPQTPAGKTKRDDDGPAVDDQPPPVPDHRRTAASSPHRTNTPDVAFAAAVQHHVTAFVTWREPEVGACGATSSGAAAVVGYRLRYGDAAETGATSTPVEMVLGSNVAAIDGLLPSAEYWYQLRYVFDDGLLSPWTEKQRLET